MKYICLGFIDPDKWTGFTEEQRQGFMDECFAYDEEMQKKGFYAGGFALQLPENAVSITWDGNRPEVTDGPYSETKEHVGGILVLEATDLNHAIQIISNHPSVRMGGPWEIRPAADLDDMVGQSQERRASAGKD